MSDFHALLVEDDPLISKSLSLSLPFAGFSVTVVESFQEGLQKSRQGSFDIVLLDVNLPDGSGFDLCRELRSVNADIPILMLTANTSENSAVTGIQCGADDYIRKPYGINELTARMRRQLEKQRRNVKTFGSLRIEEEKFMAWSGDIELSLGKREFLILALLVSSNGTVISRDQILTLADQDSEIYDRTIDSHISHLRKKLKQSGATEKIVPVYGVGYRLDSA